MTASTKDGGLRVLGDNNEQRREVASIAKIKLGSQLWYWALPPKTGGLGVWAISPPLAC